MKNNWKYRLVFRLSAIVLCILVIPVLVLLCLAVAAMIPVAALYAGLMVQPDGTVRDFKWRGKNAISEP